jgi:NAD(P)-dependent dehydrogenase (short-subunit alcohol dehydrogenase family)
MNPSGTPAAAGEKTGSVRLAGHAALITGASRGIGRGIAEALAGEGAQVILAARDEAELARVAEGIEKAGGNALPLRCDVTSEEEVTGVVKAAIAKLGRVDMLVNNAGVGVRGKIDEIAVEDWDRGFAVNLRGVFLMTRAVVPHMREIGGGHIVNISSVAGLVANPGISAYNATKFGLMGFSEALMLELRHDHIKVTTICPGSTDSYFSGQQGQAGRENFLTIDDVAHTVTEVLATAPNSLISQVHIRPLIPPKR